MIIQYALIVLLGMLEVYGFIMLIDVFLSWAPSLYNYRIFSLIHTLSNGYLGYFRGKFVIGFLDFAPMIGFSLYYFLLQIFNSLIG